MNQACDPARIIVGTGRIAPGMGLSVTKGDAT